MSDDIFHFSVSVIELELQPIGFLGCHFFIPFIRKLTQMPILIPFCRISGGINRKTKNTMRFYIIKNKNVYNFYAFMIQTDFRNISENRKFRRKNRAISSESAHFATFCFKSPLYFLKNEKH